MPVIAYQALNRGRAADRGLYMMETLSVLPDYSGGGLANVPSSLLGAFGVRIEGLLPPLTPEILDAGFLGDLDTVVLLVADGMGDHQLRTAIAAGDTPAMAGLREAAGRDPGRVRSATITSVFPSSTIPALTSLATGRPPAAHGLIAWMIHLTELGGPTEIANWRPANRIGSYLDPAWGPLDGKGFFEIENIHGILGRHHVQTFAVGPGRFLGAPFTGMLYGGSNYLPYKDPSESVALVERVLAGRRAGTRQFVHVYVPNVDSVGHAHGPRSEEHRQALRFVDDLVGRLRGLVERTPRSLLLVTADHGHVAMDAERGVDLNAVEPLFDHLAVLPTGERRVLFLHPLQGHVDQARRCLEERLGPCLEVHDAGDLAARHLFGPDGLDPRAARRIGSLVLLARENYQIIFSYLPSGRPPPHRGDHGGTHPHEMNIPLLAIRS